MATLTTSEHKLVEETIPLSADLCFSRAARVLSERAAGSVNADTEAAKVWITLGIALSSHGE